MGEFSNDWFSYRAIEFASSLGHLRHVPVRILEVGSFEGLSALWFLLFFPADTHLVCVDTFEGGAEHHVEGEPREYLLGLKDRFLRNTAFASWRIDVRVGKSEQVLFGLQPQSFDVAYVDGSHHAADALTDLVMCFHLLKPGGIMLIDDVNLTWHSVESPMYRIENSPRQAVEPFTITVS